MTRRKIRVFVSLVIISFLLPGLSFAQAGRGMARLSGQVLDEQGQPIAGARIVLTYMEGGEGGWKIEATTSKKGEWSAMGLGSGRWHLAVVAQGFVPASQDISVSQLERNPKVITKMKESRQETGGIIQDEASLELLDQGNAFFQEAKYEAALAVYQQFYEKNPAAYHVLLNIGDCYREKGEYDKAMEAFNTVLEKAKADKILGVTMTAKSLAAIGQIYLQQENFEEATKYFQQSIEAAPEDEVIAYNVGEIFWNSQKIDEAQKYFEIASSIKPSWPDPYLKLAYILLNKNDIPGAVRYFEKFLELEPPDSPRVSLVQQILQAIKK
jgi:tetratricopeptide (TPR) repeat protein